MEPTFAAALEHIKIMETRIRRQSEAVSLRRALSQDTEDADRRLKLLNFALAEMRTQLAQLAPSPEQAGAPTWALPFLNTNAPTELG
jgi:hypothetical protein